MPHADIVRRERDRRQTLAFGWAQDVFGHAKATNRETRAMRFLEEAIELAQTQGISLEQVETVARDVMSRPVGKTAQEIGGVMTTLLTLAENVGLSVDQCEFDELQRVLAEDPEVFRAKQKDKAARGLT